jgi:hypothetical protein
MFLTPSRGSDTNHEALAGVEDGEGGPSSSSSSSSGCCQGGRREIGIAREFEGAKAIPQSNIVARRVRWRNGGLAGPGVSVWNCPDDGTRLGLRVRVKG